MKLPAIVPPPAAVVREAIIVLGGLILAAAVIRMIPALQKFTESATIKIQDGNGKTLF